LKGDLGGGKEKGERGPENKKKVSSTRPKEAWCGMTERPKRTDHSGLFSQGRKKGKKKNKTPLLEHLSKRERAGRVIDL